MDVNWVAPSAASAARRKPTWLAFGLRAALLCSVIVLLTISSELLGARTRPRYAANVIAAGWVMALFWLWLSFLRYHMRRRDPLSLEGTQFRPEREAVTEASRDLTVLSKTDYRAEGKLTTGAAFSMKLWLRMGWLPLSRFRGVVRVDSPGGRAVALVTGKSATVLPPEASQGLAPTLDEAQEFLREHGGAELILGTKYIQVWIPRRLHVGDLSKAVRLALRLKADLADYQPTGYRSGAPPVASAEQIESIEAVAEATWSAFPAPRPPS